MRVGITVGENIAHFEGYRLAALRAGLEPVLLQNRFTPVEGLLFTGGGDIHPRFLPRHLPPLRAGVPSREADTLRDAFELHLFEKWYGRLPILGICRGLQVGVAALGGSLCNLPEGSHQTARREDFFHPLRALPGTPLGSPAFANVNSNHHQASLLPLPAPLQPAAFAPDGVLEAVTGEQTLLVQFHPERMPGGDILFAWLAEAMRLAQ